MPQLVLITMRTNTTPRGMPSARLSVVAVAILICVGSAANMASCGGVQHGEAVEHCAAAGQL